jgi:hypothetical protein
MPGAPAVEALRAQPQPGIKAVMKPAAVEVHPIPTFKTDSNGGTIEAGFKKPLVDTPTIVFANLGELKVTSLQTKNNDGDDNQNGTQNCETERTCGGCATNNCPMSEGSSCRCC